MTVEQLLDALRALPKNAVVLLEGDTGYSAIGGLSVVENENGLPDEVILLPDMNE